MVKIHRVLSKWVPGDVHSLKWFKQFGVTQSEVFNYWKKGVFTKIASGIYALPDEPLRWESAVDILQKELGLEVHVGGVNALELQGFAQYPMMGKRPPMRLIFTKKTNIPKWLNHSGWNVEFVTSTSKLIKGDQSLQGFKAEQKEIKISSIEQAILEYIFHSRIGSSFEEVINHLEFLQSARSAEFQKLLEKCSSVKVKRVFLYVSEKIKMPFFKHLDLSRIDLGSGTRTIIKGGEVNKKYNITVEKSIDDNPF